MFWTKKIKPYQPIPDEPKITKEENTVIEILVVNNRTGQEYQYVSTNEFGLNWDTVDGWLHIWQCLSEFDGHGLAIAALQEFSIIKVVRL